MITIGNFEENIDTRILERGFEIYKNDQILSIEEIDEGYWEAMVRGGADYFITINFHDQKIHQSNCTCPYDLGNYCKHQVAIFNFLKYADLSKIKGQHKMKKIRMIVDDFSTEKLKDCLLEILRENRIARNQFLSAEEKNNI